MLTLTDLENHVQLAIEGATTLPQSIELTQVINLAGRWFMSHPWEFRERPAISLKPLNGIEYIILPDDFGVQTTYQMSDGLNFGVTFTTPQQISHLRATTVSVSQNYYWCAIVQPGQSARNLPMPPPRLEIWPTPSATVQADLIVGYKAKWTELRYQTGGGVEYTENVEQDDVANVPDIAEMCLIEACRAFAIGWGERLSQPQGGVHGMLKALVESVMWATLVATDGMIQTDYGIMMGGAIQSRYPSHTWRSASASPVANPS